MGRLSMVSICSLVNGFRIRAQDRQTATDLVLLLHNYTDSDQAIVAHISDPGSGKIGKMS